MPKGNPWQHPQPLSSDIKCINGITMKALLHIKHTIEINHVKYYEWMLHIASNSFGGVIKSHTQFNNSANAKKSAMRIAKKIGADVRVTKYF